MKDLKLFGVIFDLDKKKNELQELTQKQSDPKVWEDHSLSQKIGKEKRILEDTIQEFEQLASSIIDNQELFNLAQEESDEDTLGDVFEDTLVIEKNLSQLEFKRMFSHPLDPNNCFIDFQSGSGGTEAQDWANMLLRMYLRYCEDKGFKVEVLETTEGEVAGIKGASIKIIGDYAYGYFRTETGIHRLVRKSPFDSGSRRHTSFAGVNVYPEIDDNILLFLLP
jgi:peptide chain release factor 2